MEMGMHFPLINNNLRLNGIARLMTQSRSWLVWVKYLRATQGETCGSLDETKRTLEPHSGEVSNFLRLRV